MSFALYKKNKGGSYYFNVADGADKESGASELLYLPSPPPKSQMINYGKPKGRQKWKRHDLPTFKARDLTWFTEEGAPEGHDEEVTWEEARRQEIAKQMGVDIFRVDSAGRPRKIKDLDTDYFYCEPALQEFRGEEYKRCIEGVWVMINGLCVYLTGPYYYYLNWWRLDIGYPEFRWVDCQDFYAHEYVRKKEEYFGRITIWPRGCGKSARMGARAHYEATFNKSARVTGQGRNDEDGERFFRNMILTPTKYLPDFLIPMHKHPKSTQSHLDYSAPHNIHPNPLIQNKIAKESLNSYMDYEKSKNGACDGMTLKFYWAEEPAKIKPTKDVDLSTRHMIVRSCVFRDHQKRGMLEYASTVEDIDHGGREFKKLWEDSDPNKKNELGMTQSGLLRMFWGAQYVAKRDEFGFPLVDDGFAYHKKMREGYRDVPADLQGWIQKYPFNVDEAFRFTSNVCHFNITILNDAATETSHNPPQRGDIVRNGNTSVWVPNPANGRWTLSYMPEKQFLNRNRNAGGILMPNNDHMFFMGVDPFLSAKTIQEGSKAGITVGMKETPHTPEEHAEVPIAHYRFKPNTTDEFHEDVIAACVFFGCQALIENTKGELAMKYLKDEGFFNYVMHIKGSWIKARPTLTAGGTPTVKWREYAMKSCYNNVQIHGHKYRHMDIIQDLIAFDPENTQPHDSAMSWLWALTASDGTNHKPIEKTEVVKLFSLYDHSGEKGTFYQ